VLGELIADLDLRSQLYLATKVDQATRDASDAQMHESQSRLKTGTIDLMQVHNLRGWQQTLPLLREWKQSGRVRYIGITTSRTEQYAEFEKVMRAEELDFVQLNYSLEQRQAAERLLPLAADRGIAVMINRAFGGGRIFAAVGEQPLPDWAAGFGCSSWAQFLLKYAVSHPAATVAIPGMTKARHVDDNLMAAQGRLPDKAERERMESFFDAL
jgi:aryl-alcohol dehydrogenase-like predicted oxidoreductase